MPTPSNSEYPDPTLSWWYAYGVPNSKDYGIRLDAYMPTLDDDIADISVTEAQEKGLLGRMREAE